MAIWDWIEQAKAAGMTIDSTVDAVEKSISSLPTNLQTEISEGYMGLNREADRLVVWEACSLLLGATASGDTFEYFRNWLIWGGQKFFVDAINQMDSLSELCELHRMDISNPFFEALSVLGTHQPMTTRSSTTAVPLTLNEFAPRNWTWSDSSAERISKDLPQLWRYYGSRFQWDPPAVPQAASFEAPGLGPVHVGDRVRHKFGYGEGVVTEVLIPDTALATIKFADESRPFRVTSEHFELVR